MDFIAMVTAYGSSNPFPLPRPAATGPCQAPTQPTQSTQATLFTESMTRTQPTHNIEGIRRGGSKTRPHLNREGLRPSPTKPSHLSKEEKGTILGTGLFLSIEINGANITKTNHADNIDNAPTCTMEELKHLTK